MRHSTTTTTVAVNGVFRERRAFFGWSSPLMTGLVFTLLPFSTNDDDEVKKSCAADVGVASAAAAVVV